MRKSFVVPIGWKANDFKQPAQVLALMPSKFGASKDPDASK